MGIFANDEFSVKQKIHVISRTWLAYSAHFCRNKHLYCFCGKNRTCLGNKMGQLLSLINHLDTIHPWFTYDHFPLKFCHLQNTWFSVAVTKILRGYPKLCLKTTNTNHVQWNKTLHWVIDTDTCTSGLIHSHALLNKCHLQNTVFHKHIYKPFFWCNILHQYTFFGAIFCFPCLSDELKTYHK